MGYDVEVSLVPAFFICMVVVILLSVLIGRVRHPALRRRASTRMNPRTRLARVPAGGKPLQDTLGMTISCH